jgi:hypothetical protein
MYDTAKVCRDQPVPKKLANLLSEDGLNIFMAKTIESVGRTTTWYRDTFAIDHEEKL